MYIHIYSTGQYVQIHCLNGNFEFDLHILAEHNPGIKQDMPVLWTNSKQGSMRVAVIYWGMQRIQ